jgi:ferric-dicitrate binding protein FerR (iron transport regulator)
MTEMRMRQSSDQFEVAFEQAADLERQRRSQLRHRAAARSHARRIQSTAKRGNVGFGLLLVALTLTVIVVTVVMFETLALLMG